MSEVLTNPCSYNIKKTNANNKGTSLKIVTVHIFLN